MMRTVARPPSKTIKARKQKVEVLEKDRKKTQSALQKISDGKEELKELEKNRGKTNQIDKIRKKEEQENELASVKSLGVNLDPKPSAKAREIFALQKDKRRKRHIDSMNDYEKWIDNFSENITERVNAKHENVNIFLNGSLREVNNLLSTLNDEELLANEVEFVNIAWESIQEYRKQRKAEISKTKDNIDELIEMKTHNVFGYLDKLEANLKDIAFYLEPKVNEIITELRATQRQNLDNELEIEAQFITALSEEEEKLFEEFYKEWRNKEERFHILKQDDAIDKFKQRMSQGYFMNNRKRIDAMARLKEDQNNVYKDRMQQISALKDMDLSMITKNLVREIGEKLRKTNDDAQELYDRYIEEMNKDHKMLMKEAMDLKDYLLGFLVKNDAKLEEGQTYESIIEQECLPVIKARDNEGKHLLHHVVKYLEEYDYKMNESSKNLLMFYRKIGELFDGHRANIKNIEYEQELSLANFGDENEASMTKRDEELTRKIEELKESVFHSEVRQRLDISYQVLDTMTLEYYKFIDDLKTLVATQMPKVENAYTEFELSCAHHFKMVTEDKREELIERFVKETEEKQKELEEEAQRKYEEEQEKIAGAAQPAGAKGKAPPKKGTGGKGATDLHVEKLIPRDVEEYKSGTGITYLLELELSELADIILKVEEEEVKIEDSEDEKKEGEEEEGQNLPKEDVPVVPATKKPPPGVKVDKKAEEQARLEQEEKLQKIEEEKKQRRKDKLEALIKLTRDAPIDPDGNMCLNEKLIIPKEEMILLLEIFRNQLMDAILNVKNEYTTQLQRLCDEIIEENVTDVTNHLKRSWPEENSLEIDIYYIRESQISGHKKKYDRHVRYVLKTHDQDDEAFDSLVSEIKSKILIYEQQLDKFRNGMEEAKNLSELQGFLRKVKESYNVLTEHVHTYFEEDLSILAIDQIEFLLKMNNDFIKSCVLFGGKEGSYSRQEVDWYQLLLDQLDNKFKESQEKRKETIDILKEDILKRQEEPYKLFEKEFATGNEGLAAREGLGKKYGRPKRIIQEKLKAEMSKCEEAQSNLDRLLKHLVSLEEEYNLKFKSSHFIYFLNRESSLSLEIRKTLMTIRQCIVRYAEHIQAFKSGFVPDKLNRVTYIEGKKGIVQTEEEKIPDLQVAALELEQLGQLGFSNKANQTNYNASWIDIEKEVKAFAQKLYTGNNANILQGVDKIPEYLEIYLENTKNYAEEFRLNLVRKLRATCGELLIICEKNPVVIYGSIKYKNMMQTKLQEDLICKKYEEELIENSKQKENHLKLLRPGLGNPACKEELDNLESTENNRSEHFKEIVDEAQVTLIQAFEISAQAFFAELLNGTEAFLTIYSTLFFFDDFQPLPGDDILEKKHLNLKNLVVKKEKEGGYVESSNRGLVVKWKGLNKLTFVVDIADRPEGRAIRKEEEEEGVVEEEEGKEAELTEEFETIKTPHHKLLIKKRDEAFKTYNEYFKDGINFAFHTYDKERIEEYRFKKNFQNNVKILRDKQSLK